MAARKKKTTAKKSSTKATTKQPKFGSAAWFAKYPKAKRLKAAAKGKKTRSKKKKK